MQISQHNLSCENESWEKLYLYCLQYEEVAARPLGLVMDCKSGLIGYMAKSMFKFLIRPDPRNELFNCTHTTVTDALTSTGLIDIPNLLEDDAVISTIQGIICAVQLLNTCLPDDIQFTLEEQIKRGNSALTIVEELFEESLFLYSNDTNDTNSLTFELNQLSNRFTHHLEAFALLIKQLELNDEINIDQELSYSMTSTSFTKLFTSVIGIKSLSQGFKQFARTRLLFCRNLLFLYMLIQRNREKGGNLIPSDIEKLHSAIAIPLSHLIQSYYILVFFAESPCQLLKYSGKNDKCIDVHDAHLSALELTEYINSVSISSSNNNRLDDECNTLLEEFVTKKGLTLSESIVYKKYMDEPPIHSVWTTLYPDIILTLAQILWPTCFSTPVAEFLLGCRNHHKLGEYLDLCDSWIQYHTNSRTFLRAYQKLINGEAKQAVILFNQSLIGITTEPFLRSFSNVTDSMELDEEPIELPASLIFNYYTKVIKLFKNQGEIECVVILAQEASQRINSLNDTLYDEHISSLNANLFLNFLSLKKYDDAYSVMARNPDIERRRSCLRQFIVKLFDEKRTKELISFNYTDFQDDFISIIESKARSFDLTCIIGCGYYELLYSFFIKNCNYRRAASIMYEYGRRLSQEVPGLSSLGKQISCYLTCLNCLKMVNSKYAWIVKPSIRLTDTNTSVLPKVRVNDLKRCVDTDSPTKIGKREIELLDSNDIRIEYELARARSRLLLKDEKLNDIACTSLAPSEVLTLLISNSLFDHAFRLAQATNLSYEPIIKGIASKYIRIIQLSNFTRQGDDVLAEAYECFADNDTIGKTFIGSSQTSVTKKMWLLTMTYLIKYEKVNSTCLHRCLTEEILAAGIGIPTSLRASYQVSN